MTTLVLEHFKFSSNDAINFSAKCTAYYNKNNENILFIFVTQEPNTDYRIINKSEIKKYELIFDDATVKSSGIRDTIIGGVIAGTTGMIVGSNLSTSKQLISQIVIHIFSDNYSITVPLHDGNLSKTSPEYASIVQRINKLCSILDSFIKRNS